MLKNYVFKLLCNSHWKFLINIINTTIVNIMLINLVFILILFLL